MPARPLSDESLQLIGAVREAMAHRSDVDERMLFGCWSFFVDGKLCIGVKGEELLVRLPPDRHAEFQEMRNTRELSPIGSMQGYFWVEPHGYARSAQWAFWIDEALAYNPRAKATPPRKNAPAATPVARFATPTPAHGKRHRIFEADDD